MEKKKKELEKLRKTVVKKECEGGEDGEEVRILTVDYLGSRNSSVKREVLIIVRSKWTN